MKTLALSDQIPFLSPMSSAEGGGPARAAEARILPEGQEAFETILAESPPLSEDLADPAAEPSTPRPVPAPGLDAAAGMQDLARPTAEAAVVANLQGALPITADPAAASQAAASQVDPGLSRAILADKAEAGPTGAPELPHRQKLSAADKRATTDQTEPAAVAAGKDASDGPAKAASAVDTSAPVDEPRPAGDGADTAATPVPIGETSTVKLSAEAEARTKAAQAFATMASIGAATPSAAPMQGIRSETVQGTGPARIAQAQQPAAAPPQAEPVESTQTQPPVPTADTAGSDVPQPTLRARAEDPPVATPKTAAAESATDPRTEAPRPSATETRPTEGGTGEADATRQDSAAATAASDRPVKAGHTAEPAPAPFVATVTAPQLPGATSARAAQASDVTGIAGAQQPQQSAAAALAPRHKAKAGQAGPRKTIPVADSSAPGTEQAKVTTQPVKATEPKLPLGTATVTVQTVAAAEGPVPAAARPAAETAAATAAATTALPAKTVSLAESRINAALAAPPTETEASPEPVAASAAMPVADKAGAVAPGVATAALAASQPTPGPVEETPPRVARLRRTPEAAPVRDRAPSAAQASVAEMAVKATETAAAPATTPSEGAAPTTSASAPMSFSTPLGAERAGHLTGGSEAAAAQRAASPHAIAHQMSQALADAGNRTVELTLSPEELGKVRMTLTSNDGAITVTVQAERPETLDLMRRNIDSLARDFRDMGYSNIGFDFGQQTDQRPSAQERAAESALQPAAPERDGLTRFETFPTPPQSAPGTASGGLDLRI